VVLMMYLILFYFKKELWRTWDFCYIFLYLWKRSNWQSREGERCCF